MASSRPTPDPVPGLERELERRTRHLGAHYTPHALARRAAATALAPLLRGLSPARILRLRVLDPAVGSARFLLAALHLLADATGDPARHRAGIAARCLFGIDLHPDAAALARLALARAAGVDPADLTRQIVAADSLLGDAPALLGHAAFDGILTNPPWASYSGRQAAAISPGRRRRLAERYAAFRRWPTAHGAFLELAAGLLAPGGRAALILPQQVTHLPGYQAARRAALERCVFQPAPEPLGEDAFPGVVQPAAVVYLHRPPPRAAVQPPAPCSSGPLVLFTSRPAGEALPDGRPTPRGPTLVLRSDDPAAAVVRQALRHPPPPPRTFRDPGVHTGNSARRILHDEPAPGRAPVREGRCVHPFALEPPRRWIDVAPDLPAGHYCTIRPPDTYASVPIVLRQTAARPVAARHVEPTYFRNSILACVGIPGVERAALVGLLNSALIAFVHRQAHADSRQRAFPQVKVSHLQALPIARHAADLAPCAARLERLAADRLLQRRRLLEAIAGILQCPVGALAGARGAGDLHRFDPSRLAATLARRVPDARPVLRRPAVQRAIETARAAAHEAIAALDASLHARTAELDSLVCRLYGLTARQAALVRGA